MKLRGLQRSGAVLATLLGWGCWAAAESPVFQHFGLADGLPSERVFALDQDAQGDIWMATADGLARFDGLDWQVFQHRPGDPQSLPANMLQAVHVDAEGRVWIGTEGAGLAYLDRDHGAFRRWPGATALEQGDVWAIHSDAAGALWIGGFNLGVYRIDLNGEGAQHWRAGDGAGLDGDTLLRVAEHAGEIWIGTDQGLQVWRGQRFERIASADAAFGRSVVLDIQSDEGELLVATPAGLFVGGEAGFEQRDATPPQPVFAVLREAADGSADAEIWLGRRHGLQRLSELAKDPEGNLPARFGAGGSTVVDMLRDHEGGIWFASLGGGVRRLPAQWRRFRSWVVGPEGLSSRAPTASAFGTEQGLWVGGGDGRVDRIEIASGAVRALIEPDPSWPDRVIGGLVSAQDGALWIGHRRGYLRWHAGQGLRHYPAGDQADSPWPGPTGQMLEDGAGGFWRLVAGQGVEHVGAAGDILARWGADQGLQPADVEQMLRDAEGRMWLAGAFGLAELRGDGRMRPFALPSSVPVRLWGAARGADGTWFASTQRGVFALAPSASRDLPATVVMGPLLSGPELSGLALDSGGQLWAASLRGLWRIDPVQGRVLRFGLDEGLPGQEFSTWPMSVSPTGQLAAVLPDAVVLIEPRRVLPSTRVAEPRAMPIVLSRGEHNLSFDWPGPVPLDHADREIRLQQRLVSFAHRRDWRFEFRLEGFDADWVAADQHGVRVLSALPPGGYRLQARAQDPHGVWRAQPDTLLRVAPPWWATAPARIALVLMLGMLLYLAFRWMRARAEARAAASLFDSQRRWALQASAQKSRFLAELAHEIRTPMTGLMGMSELLEESDLDDGQRDRVRAIRRSGRLLLRLVNDALDLARIEAGKLALHPRLFELPALVRDTVDIQRGLAAAHGCSLQLECEPGAPRWIELDADRLQQILLNLLGNAIRYAGGKPVRIRLAGAPAPDNLMIQVIDQGIGMDDAQQARLFQQFSQVGDAAAASQRSGSGLGLMLSRQLAEALGARLALRSAIGVGTTVSLLACWPPREPAIEAAPAPIDVRVPSEQPLRGRRLLLVEDDAAAAEALAGLLGHLGAEVDHAAHALDALAALEAAAARHAEFHAAIIDLDLPGMHGEQLAALVGPRWPACRLVALSASGAEDFDKRCSEAGFLRWARKPVDRADLLRLLDGDQPPNAPGV